MLLLRALRAQPGDREVREAGLVAERCADQVADGLELLRASATTKAPHASQARYCVERAGRARSRPGPWPRCDVPHDPDRLERLEVPVSTDAMSKRPRADRPSSVHPPAVERLEHEPPRRREPQAARAHDRRGRLWVGRLGRRDCTVITTHVYCDELQLRPYSRSAIRATRSHVPPAAWTDDRFAAGAVSG